MLKSNTPAPAQMEIGQSMISKLSNRHIFDVRKVTDGKWEAYDMTTEKAFRDRPALGDAKETANAMAEFLNAIFDDKHKGMKL